MKQPPASIRRLVYLGTPAIAVPPLYALAEAGFEIPLVVTNRDKRRGRGGDLTPTPVKKAAGRLDIPVSHRVADVLDAEADLGVVVAFGRLIKPAVLDEIPMVNIHFSLLPRWRGAAPLERAILAGDAVTGVCLMELAYELDTGAVYARREVPIAPHATLDSLREELVFAACDLLVEQLQTGLDTPEPQSGEVTWAAKIDPEEMRIDFASSAQNIERLTRIGRAHTFFRGQRLVVHEVRVVDEDAPDLQPGEISGVHIGTADGVLELIRVQPEGKAVMDANAWVNGARLQPTDRLGT